MLWKLLLIGIFLPACLGDVFSLTPMVQAAGHHPRTKTIAFMWTSIAAISNPPPAVVPAAFPANSALVIDFAGLTNAHTQLAINYGWVPFIRNLNTGAAVVVGSVLDFVPVAITNSLAAYSYSPQQPPTTTCLIPQVGTNLLGTRLVLGFGGAVLGCVTGSLYETNIPLVWLAPNAPFPEALVDYTFFFVNTIILAAFLTTAVQRVDVPWKTASTQLITSSLHVTSAVPSSTLLSTQALNSLTVTFTPGKQLGGGMWISFVGTVNVPTVVAGAAIPATPLISYQGLFAPNPVAAAGQTLPTISVCVGGGQTIPTDIYCCPSVASQPGGTTDSTRLRVQLSTGCQLPAGKEAIAVIPQVYLNAYPTLPATAGSSPTNPVWATTPIALVVNLYMSTSSDPQFTHEARYGQMWAGTIGVMNAAGILDFDASSVTMGNYIASWRAGATAVTNFGATPSTTTTGVVPAQLVLRWTLTTGIPDPTQGTVAPATGVTVTAAALPTAITFAARFCISANPGVIRPNIGSLTNQFPFPPTTGPCGRATYYSNEAAQLCITPNPVPVVPACYTQGLTAGTILTYTIPSSALLPNPSPQNIMFDIYGIGDQFTAALAAPAPSIPIIWNGIDAATAKNQFGYTTTVGCNTEAVPNFLFTSPNDIASLQWADRARLVAAISAMSTGPAAIVQCLSGAQGGTVSWVKYPEGTWRSNMWPNSNIAALGGWPQQVGTNPAIFIANWGHMVSYPMFAITVSYPPQLASLQSLGITDTPNAGWRLVFIVRIDRLTLSSAIASLSNPWQFNVLLTLPVVAVRHIGTGNVVRGIAAVTPVEALIGGGWAQSNGVVGVTVPQSGVVFGYAAVNPSPIPDNGSDDALFGLLALIAVPVLLCCCLLALLWFLRPKAEACPCVPEYPVQEMYWVNAQPCAPTFSVAQCGPSTTPVYLVQ